MNLKIQGFTLIELLVTISIIGVLSTAVLAGMASTKDKAKEAAITVEATQMMKVIQAALTENTSNNYSPMYTAHWSGYVGDADCDSPPAWFPAAYTAELTAACHKLYEVGGISPINAGNPTRPVLMGIYQRYNSPPWQTTYTADWGMSIKTANGNLLCVGGTGRSYGPYDLARSGSSCYYAPPTLP